MEQNKKSLNHSKKRHHQIQALRTTTLPASLIFFLAILDNKLGLDNNGLVLQQNTFFENLKVPKLCERCLVLLGGLHFLREQRPQLVDVEDWRVEFVVKLVKIAHSILAEEDPAMVHAFRYGRGGWCWQRRTTKTRRGCW